MSDEDLGTDIDIQIAGLKARVSEADLDRRVEVEAAVTTLELTAGIQRCLTGLEGSLRDLNDALGRIEQRLQALEQREFG